MSNASTASNYGVVYPYFRLREILEDAREGFVYKIALFQAARLRSHLGVDGGRLRERVAEVLGSLESIQQGRLSAILERNDPEVLASLLLEASKAGSRGDLESIRGLDVTRVWGLGLASLSEVLMLSSPSRFIAWNSRVVRGLERLGVERVVFGFAGLQQGRHQPSTLTLEKYLSLLGPMEALRDAISGEVGLPLDFLDVYIVLTREEVLEEFLEVSPGISPATVFCGAANRVASRRCTPIGIGACSMGGGRAGWMAHHAPLGEGEFGAVACWSDGRLEGWVYIDGSLEWWAAHGVVSSLSLLFDRVEVYGSIDEDLAGSLAARIVVRG
ncbi:MAG: hypothetical protein F7B20_01920 [Aeropyrum sp.]|nr:hypothetical protein [Aeropyrum sp.]MCE4616684.1 hypothetical protein [Aeropyrum sp.]